MFYQQKSRPTFAVKFGQRFKIHQARRLDWASTKTFEKLQKWADNVAPSSRVVDPIVKAKKTLEKVESKLRPKPIVNGMESRIEAVFTKALHKAFPMVSEKVPVAKVTASDRGAEYQCTSAMSVFKILKGMEGGMDALEKCRLKQVHLNRNLRSGERHSEDLTLTAEED